MYLSINTSDNQEQLKQMLLLHAWQQDIILRTIGVTIYKYRTERFSISPEMKVTKCIYGEIIEAVQHIHLVKYLLDGYIVGRVSKPQRNKKFQNAEAHP